MEFAVSVLVGYLLGSLNPSALIARIRRVDIREKGTGNLGATNVMLNFGKLAGVLVMLFDAGKAYAAFIIAERLFPGEPLAGFLSGCAAVVGHIFPFYLGFRGGKGLASLGGLVLAFDPAVFLALLIVGVTLMVATDFSLCLQFSVAVLFPVLAAVRSGSIAEGAAAAAVCLLMLFRHRENIASALRGEHVKVSTFIREHFTK